MSDLTGKFSTLEAEIAANQEDMMALLSTIDTNVGGLGEAITTLNNSMQSGFRTLQGFIGANDPCGCAGTPTLRVPPLGATPIGVSSDQCKRIQAFLHTMQEIFTVLDAASAFSVGLNFSLISNSINEVVGAIETGSDLPVISYPEGVRLVGDMINYLAGNLLVGGDLSSYFAGVILDLRDGMSLATSPSAARSLYESVIDGSTLPDYVKPVIKDGAYGAIYSYYFDTSTSPDLTGYDGGLCAGGLPDITSCTDFDSVPFSSGGHDFYVLHLPPAYGPFPEATAIDFFGYSYQLIAGGAVHGIQLYYWTMSDVLTFHHDAFLGDAPRVMEQHTNAIIIQSGDRDGDAVSFTCQICPPA